MSPLLVHRILVRHGGATTDPGGALTVETLAGQVAAVARAADLHERIPGSQYAEIAGGHLVLFERPDDLVELVRTLID